MKSRSFPLTPRGIRDPTIEKPVPILRSYRRDRFEIDYKNARLPSKGRSLSTISVEIDFFHEKIFPTYNYNSYSLSQWTEFRNTTSKYECRLITSHRNILSRYRIIANKRKHIEISKIRNSRFTYSLLPFSLCFAF